MFNALNIYRFTGVIPFVSAGIARAQFNPCLPHDDKSVGWVPPRNEQHGALIESVNGHYILKLMIETKSVPASAIKKEVEKAADHIEQTTGRKPGKKERKALKEDAYAALLPSAFPRQSSVLVWVDHGAGLLMTDASSQGRNDEAITALVRAFDGLQIALVQTKITPLAAMTGWLSSQDKEEDNYIEHGFTVERSCELRSDDEEKSVVRFKNHNLDNDEVRKHVAEGKLPVKLALSYQGRIAFELDQAMTIKGIKYLEGVFDKRGDNEDSGFDADVTLATGELKPLIKDLIDALGGEVERAA